ncbi:DNA-binding protein [Halobacteriales archaeon QS_3_64_16]|nr:MAG: DNA-binding protein [Halobacteriales archaeon QS_3_64_16]
MRSFEIVLAYSSATIHPVHEFITQSEVVDSERLLYGTVTDDGLDTFLFQVKGEAEAYTEALDTTTAVERYDITVIDETSFYAYLEHEAPEIDESLLAAFSRPGVIVVPPVEFRADGTARLTIISDGDELQALLAEIPDGIATEVTRIVEYAGEPSNLLSTLSSRQLEAISIGVDIGYYEIPRQGSVEDIARQMNCAPGTAAEHLQKAESQLLTAIINQREGAANTE